MTTIGPVSPAAAAWGWPSGTWNYPASFVDLVTVADDPSQAWWQFNGFSSALTAGSITSAILSINLPDCPAKGITVYADSAENAVCPVDGTDAAARVMTTAYATADLAGSGVHSVNVDITAIIEELRGSIDGDKIVIRVTQNEADINVEDVEASLTVTYPGGTIETTIARGAIGLAGGSLTRPHELEEAAIGIAGRSLVARTAIITALDRGEIGLGSSGLHLSRALSRGAVRVGNQSGLNLVRALPAGPVGIAGRSLVARTAVITSIDLAAIGIAGRKLPGRRWYRTRIRNLTARSAAFTTFSASSD